MTSANPATPLTRAEFRNSCTSVLQGLDCLFRQEVLLNEALNGALQELGTVTMNLMPEIENNTEYFVDGPLVRYLTAEVSKAKGIIQEIKRTCSRKSLELNGTDYIDRHSEQHLVDVQSVLESLNTFYQDTLFRRDTQHIEKQVQARMSPSSMPPPPSAIKTPQNTPAAQNGRGASRVSFATSAPAQLGATTSYGGGEARYPNPSIPGAFEHMHDVATRGRQPHSDSWPKDREIPPNVLENTRPPLVYPGLRDVHNYRNLPQFTGVNLPIPTVPAGELGHRSQHTQHWGHTNKHVY